MVVTDKLLLVLWQQYKKGLLTQDEWFDESVDVMRDSLLDELNTFKALIYGYPWVGAADYIWTESAKDATGTPARTA